MPMPAEYKNASKDFDALWRDYSLAPETATTDIAHALRRSSIDTSSLDRVLWQLPEGVAGYWAVAEWLSDCGWKVQAVIRSARLPHVQSAKLGIYAKLAGLLTLAFF